MTLKPLVRTDRKRPDGTYRVYVRLTHQRATRYLPTTLVARQRDIGRHGEIRSTSLALKCANLTDRMYRTVEDLTWLALSRLDVDTLRDYIQSRIDAGKFSLDFFEWAEQCLSEMTIAENTKASYITSICSFKKWTGPNIDINAITSAGVKNYVASLSINPNTAKQYIARLGKIYSAARYKYNTEDDIKIPNHPFKDIKIEHVPAGGAPVLESWQMQQLIDADDATPAERWALDVFCLSFCLMGANLADIYEMKKPVRGEIRYNRVKTRGRRDDHAEMRVKVTPEAEFYINALGEGKGELLLDLHVNNMKHLHQKVGRALRSWTARHSMSGVQFYSARKAWATTARSSGVEKATVDECLAHVGDFPIADIYIQRDWSIMAKANRKVLDRFRWPVNKAGSSEKICNFAVG